MSELPGAYAEKAKTFSISPGAISRWCGNVSQGPLEARTTLRLRSLEMRGQDRIARLQQDIEVATATSLVQITGGGTIDVNLGRGFVSGTETEWRISETMPVKDSTEGPPFFGSIKISVTAN